MSNEFTMTPTMRAQAIAHIDEIMSTLNELVLASIDVSLNFPKPTDPAQCEAIDHLANCAEDASLAFAAATEPEWENIAHFTR